MFVKNAKIKYFNWNINLRFPEAFLRQKMVKSAFCVYVFCLRTHFFDFQFLETFFKLSKEKRKNADRKKSKSMFYYFRWIIWTMFPKIGNRKNLQGSNSSTQGFSYAEIWPKMDKNVPKILGWWLTMYTSLAVPVIWVWPWQKKRNLNKSFPKFHSKKLQFSGSFSCFSFRSGTQKTPNISEREFSQKTKVTIFISQKIFFATFVISGQVHRRRSISTLLGVFNHFAHQKKIAEKK